MAATRISLDRQHVKSTTPRSLVYTDLSNEQIYLSPPSGGDFLLKWNNSASNLEWLNITSLPTANIYNTSGTITGTRVVSFNNRLSFLYDDTVVQTSGIFEDSITFNATDVSIGSSVINLTPSLAAFTVNDIATDVGSGVNISPNLAKLFAEHNTTGDNVSLEISSQMGIISSTYPTFAGLEYFADYSANFTALSLVTKDYVDTAITGAAMTDLTFTGASSPVTLNSSTGTDVVFTAGTGISLSQITNDLTISTTITQYTDELAQDAVGTILVDTDTIDLTYNDGTPSITAAARLQMSITSDASGIKLVNDASTPGNEKYYGTDGTGVKGFFDLPTGVNIYNADGTLTGNRVLTGGTNSLTFNFDDGAGITSDYIGGVNYQGWELQDTVADLTSVVSLSTTDLFINLSDNTSGEAITIQGTTANLDFYRLGTTGTQGMSFSGSGLVITDSDLLQGMKYAASYAAYFATNPRSIPDVGYVQTLIAASPSGTITGTGTINYLPKWTSSSALGNSLVYDNGTSVGVGITSGSAKFNIMPSGNMFQGGAYEIGHYSVNLAWSANNMYYNGSNWVYRNTGKGSTLWYNDGKLEYKTAPSASAGTTMGNPLTRFRVLENGDIERESANAVAEEHRLSFKSTYRVFNQIKSVSVDGADGYLDILTTLTPSAAGETGLITAMSIKRTGVQIPVGIYTENGTSDGTGTKTPAGVTASNWSFIELPKMPSSGQGGAYIKFPYANAGSNNSRNWIGIEYNGNFGQGLTWYVGRTGNVSVAENQALRGYYGFESTSGSGIPAHSFLGKISINPTNYIVAGTAYLHIGAGTATASTAPLKFTSGTNLTTPEAGAMEWDGSRAYITQTSGPTRQTLAYLTDITGSITGNSGQVAFFNSGTTITSESSDFTWDSSTNRLGIRTSGATAAIDIRGDSLGTTQTTTDGLALVNFTAAAAGAQQISPAIRWRGFGWKTNSTAASQSVEFRSYVVPVQGAAAPTGNLSFGSAINASWTNDQFIFTTAGQFAIGTTTPAVTSILDLTSTTLGVLLPRMNSTQKNAISSPANGLLVYDTTFNKLNIYESSAWRALSNGIYSGSGSLITNTLVTADTYTLQLQGSSATDKQVEIILGSSTDEITLNAFDGTGVGAASIGEIYLAPAFASIGAQHNNIPGSENGYINFQEVNSTWLWGNHQIIMDGSGIFITDAVSTGLVYTADYSSSILANNSSIPDIFTVRENAIENYSTITSTTSPVNLNGVPPDYLIAQGSTQATFTFSLPASPVNGEVCKLTFANAVTTLTITAQGGITMLGTAPTTAVIGTQLEYKYYHTITSWIRVK